MRMFIALLMIVSRVILTEAQDTNCCKLDTNTSRYGKCQCMDNEHPNVTNGMCECLSYTDYSKRIGRCIETYHHLTSAYTGCDCLPRCVILHPLLDYYTLNCYLYEYLYLPKCTNTSGIFTDTVSFFSCRLYNVSFDGHPIFLNCSLPIGYKKLLKTTKTHTTKTLTDSPRTTQYIHSTTLSRASYFYFEFLLLVLLKLTHCVFIASFYS